MSDRIVAILGTAPSTRHLANEQPYPEVEVWALNDCWSFVQRPWQRWFEIHGLSLWKADGPEHEEFLRTGQSPSQPDCYAAPGAQVMMLGGTQFEGPEQYAHLPMATPYPYEAIVERFGMGNNTDHPYLTSTIDYMIALAIYEGVDEIKVFGINHSTSTEYQHQRPAAEYWLGMVQASGIRLTIPDICPLLQAPLYGPKRKGYIDEKRLETRQARLSYELDEISNVKHQLDGAAQTIHEIRDRFIAVPAMEWKEVSPGVTRREYVEAPLPALPPEYLSMLDQMEGAVASKQDDAEKQLQAVHGAHQFAGQMLNLVREPITIENVEVVDQKGPVTATDGESVISREAALAAQNQMELSAQDVNGNAPKPKRRKKAEAVA